MRKVLWIELGEVKAGCERDEAVCVMGDMNALTGELNANGVSADFGVEEVDEN